MTLAPRARAALLSLLVLIPCFWQRRIQAGDLGSHIYNAWLAQQVELGKAPGLQIVPLTTNVLFDLILGRLYGLFGAPAAERIVVSCVVLLFFWGAFRLIQAVSGVRPWFLTPCLLMLTYGWTYHIGFFNFYLSLGLSFWALALAWKGGPPARCAAAALLAIAYAGHILPPLWALGVFSYTWISQRLPGKFRLLLFALACDALALLRFWITSRYHTAAFFTQALEASATDQIWDYGSKYFGISIALGALWSFLLLRMSHLRDLKETVSDAVFQIGALMAAGILLLPTRVEFPQYKMALTYITERMTLAHAVWICTFLAAARPPKWLQIAFLPLAACYFSFVYIDTRHLNDVERQMELLTGNLPPGSRVITNLADPASRIPVYIHNLDRVCVARCLSYGNYEPHSLAFRVQAVRANPFVVTDPVDFGGIEFAGYVVKPGVLPLYQIGLCPASAREICLRPLPAGYVTQLDSLPISPPLGLAIAAAAGK